jgi:hypothetical protein
MASTTIAFGAHVSNRNGRPLGRVTRAAVDPATRRLAALVVGDGPLTIDERVVDGAMVERQADGAVFLSVDDDESARLPPFARREVARVREPDTAPILSHTFDPVVGFSGGPDEGDAIPELHSGSSFGSRLPETDIVQTVPGIPEGSVVMTKRTAVVSADGVTAGHLHALSLDEQHRVVDLVHDSDPVFTYHVRVPMSWVAELTPDRVLLTKGIDAVTADIRPA